MSYTIGNRRALRLRLLLTQRRHGLMDCVRRLPNELRRARHACKRR